ncbi:hypothetical protein Ddye_026081 [Dipteronia dyeriana]|uniref:DUF4283 domain-containing protein n=1 Tax=Dipteronia dyeriana TaxID=168575 RepID=A0AAD9TM22_9ROSI|nr:hypothetical protein Ddye_026081 [Dipteronia dyeriana]
MKSYAQAISSAITPVSSAPKKKGDYVTIKVNPKAYEERLKLYSYSLIGRVILLKGEEPWKGIRPLHLKHGTLRLQPWTQNFNPNTQRTTNAQIWVRFYDLPWKFWHPQILLDMARGIEIPLKFDRATLEGDYGHFTHMLIDVDLSKPLPDSIMIEVGDDCLFPTLFFKNVPSFCSVCCSIGHSATSCHHATRFTGNITAEPNDKIPERGRSKIRQEYRPKHKSRDVPTSRVFETIKSGIDVIVTKPVTSPPNKTTLDPTTSSSSLRPIIPNGHGEALKNDAYLDDSTDPLHTEHVDIDPMSYPVIADMEASIDPPRVEPHLHNPKGKASSDTDSEGTESNFSHPTTLDITGVQGLESWADQSEDSSWKKVTPKKDTVKL